ncbi:hypothetical protein CDD83_466 [Cordyceps sp. RAO-2017]|nr:hypothetical protein CDD83_466 [Cordyceps sp. RAO-2017]
MLYVPKALSLSYMMPHTTYILYTAAERVATHAAASSLPALGEAFFDPEAVPFGLRASKPGSISAWPYLDNSAGCPTAVKTRCGQADARGGGREGDVSMRLGRRSSDTSRARSRGKGPGHRAVAAQRPGGRHAARDKTGQSKAAHEQSKPQSAETPRLRGGDGPAPPRPPGPRHDRHRPGGRVSKNSRCLSLPLSHTHTLSPTVSARVATDPSSPTAATGWAFEGVREDARRALGRFIHARTLGYRGSPTGRLAARIGRFGRTMGLYAWAATYEIVRLGYEHLSLRTYRTLPLAARMLRPWARPPGVGWAEDALQTAAGHRDTGPAASRQSQFARATPAADSSNVHTLLRSDTYSTYFILE